MSMRWTIGFVVAVLIVWFALLKLLGNSQIPQYTLPEVVLVAEMMPFAEEYVVEKNIPVEWENLFLSQWRLLIPTLEEKITSDVLLEISRWAKEEMKGYVPPQGWVTTIPMNQRVRFHSSVESILFSQETEKGFAIPSHSSIVFRRIVLGGVYDTKLGKIQKIYVTIRGWKEE